MNASRNQQGPDWNLLFEVASAQEGYFSTAQAKEAGYSSQLLKKHLDSGRIERIRRAVYRLVHFPPGDHEDLVVLWLWSNRIGVFSHDTALALHQLSDVLPSIVHMTVPEKWKIRRMKVPKRLKLHFSGLQAEDESWIGAIKVTSPRRTVLDCAESQFSPDLLKQAIREGLDKGHFSQTMVMAAIDYVRAFEGIPK